MGYKLIALFILVPYTYNNFCYLMSDKCFLNGNEGLVKAVSSHINR